MAASASASSASPSGPPVGTLYGHQADLQSLPVPPLEDLMEKLLKTVRPHVTDEEFEHTRSVCAEFAEGKGRRLQEMLEERAAESRNWLEEWWETFAYLQPRYPAAVNINWFGLLPGTWGTNKVSQALSAAILTRHLVLFRRDVLQGRLDPETMGGQKLCMNQWTRMFNTCKVPVDETTDELREHNDLELDSIAVICDGAVFSFPVVQAGLREGGAKAMTDKETPPSADEVEVRGAAAHLPYDDPRLVPLAVGDLELQFNRVLEASSVLFELRKVGEHASLFTAEDRARWAKAYEQLVALDATNAASLQAIERSLFVIVLEHESKPGLEQRARSALLGTGHDCRNRWFDKPFNLISYPDGKTSVNGEHAWADAMVMASVFGHILDRISAEFKEHGGPLRLKGMGEALPPPKRLEFVLDTPAKQSLELASTNGYRLAQSIDLRLLIWPHFGKGLVKRYRLMPDFFVQHAIQLAYRRFHGKHVATYETAHTRLFYHGRTETIRVCSEESVAFTSLMLDEDATDGQRFDALKKSIQAHFAFTKDCLLGAGVDRHLMGLYILGRMEGLDPMPPIFSDAGVKRAGRYTLSTSNISMRGSPLFGGFSPMYEDGYGVCYGIQEDTLKFSITANNNCKDTSAEGLRQALADSLADLQRVLLSRNLIYVGAQGSKGAGAAPRGEVGGKTTEDAADKAKL